MKNTTVDPELIAAVAEGRREDEVDRAMDEIGTPRFRSALDDIPERLNRIGEMSNREVGEFLAHATAANGEALRRIAKQRALLARIKQDLQVRAAEIREAARASDRRATDDEVLLDPVIRTLQEQKLLQERVFGELAAAQKGLEATAKAISRQITVRVGEGAVNRLEDGVAGRGRRGGGL